MDSRTCEMCSSSPAPAVLYCDADACYLCADCDQQVHQANRFAQRHIRRPVSSLQPHKPTEQDPDDGNAHDREASFDNFSRNPSVASVDHHHPPPPDHSLPNSCASDLLVPDVITQNTLARSPSEEETYHELFSEQGDMSYADFDDFECVGFAKFPTFTSTDSECAFFATSPSHQPLIKSFDTADLPWESVGPLEFDHVVPDVEIGVSTSSRSIPAIIKPDMPLDQPSGGEVSESDATTTAGSPLSTGVNNAIISSSNEAAPTSCSSFTDPCPSSHKEPSSEMNTEVVDSAAICPLKSAEQRKKLRLEALARFRSKRASRNFQKKIRYNCRKMLADSRPRVKGRFVKKSEMALYRQYGANYREHLDDPLTDFLVPNIDLVLETS